MKDDIPVLNNRKKCPFLSPRLECLSTGEGTFACLNEEFHEACDHKHRALSRTMRARRPERE